MKKELKKLEALVEIGEEVIPKKHIPWAKVEEPAPPIDFETVDWETLSHQLPFAEYHDLRKKHGLE